MSTQPKKKQEKKAEKKGKDGLTSRERMRLQDEKIMRERNKQASKKRMEEKNKEENEKAQKERRDKARDERLKKESQERAKQRAKDRFKENLKNKSSKKPKEGKKLPGEGVEKTPAKMPDGYNMKRPAEKLGYIQQLGAGRMSPGKMGDMTAMKMMHGDAAAKFYDGAGMYMNGAPRYIGASKSYMGPGAHKPGHEGIGDDRPSYTKQTTTTEVIPGKSSSTSTKSSGGSTSGRTNFSSDPEERAKQKQWIKDNPEAYKKALADKKKKFDAGSSSSSKSTQPTVKQTKKSETITSNVPGQSEQNKASKEVNVNMAERYKAGQKELINLAKQDSTKIAQKILKDKPITKNLIQYATQQGNIGGYNTARKGTQGRGTFDTNKGEFKFSKEQAAQLFNPNIGKAKAVVTDGYTYEKHKSGSKNVLNPDGKVDVRVKKGSTQTLSNDVRRKGMFTAEDVGTTQKITTKNVNRKGERTGIKSRGERKITSVDTDTGSQGSFGGFNTAKEFLQNFKDGTPKMPKGPMKFGMKK